MPKQKLLHLKSFLHLRFWRGQLSNCMLTGVVFLMFNGIIQAQNLADTTIYIPGNSVSFSSTFSEKNNLPELPLMDSTISMETSRKRVRFMSIAQPSAYAAAMGGLYAAWYANYPQSKFHFFNDNAEWKGIDKLGHAYSAYAESKASMELWRWTGINRKKRIWLGGLSGAAYQTVIETLDGFSSEWGWSWGDFGSNIAGSALVISQELAWDEQRVQFKWSFHRKKYATPELQQRSNEIFGTSTAERNLKDYNGQTYWLSTTLKPFFPQSNLPAWLQVSVGTGAEGLFGARSNIATNKNGVTTFYHPEIKRYRQWFLAPDIDLTKIKTRKKGIKIALNVLSIFKFPTPSLEYGNGNFKINWLHF